ncbi:D-alanyl-D-alanine carboxypeptidase family protein [Fictibacillus terranigra]|uniref:D-alanyl-D-alanine carboxypeptidase family protein n=1 Tax=Fictibacillus terranigra TaxID=3058424 RepID=A0ABT8E8P8_9BACL|nr:D-alanyl-D-alanine carboxypeptidase family protein [Fictibacillus sp. CENA-BCM004]MDN4074275.1 D-alanyl-D-alanine carboxypeptidase family protein [Fictibacillus sp. CENA-BCM004]
MKTKFVSGAAIALSLALFAGCSNNDKTANEKPSHKTEKHEADKKNSETQKNKTDENKKNDDTKKSNGNVSQDPEPKKDQEKKKNEPSEPSADENKKPAQKNDDSVSVAAHPESIPVLVNKRSKLPENYKPSDLVYPDVAFIFSEKIEKRMMRKAAADALEDMFAAAKKEGINLTGVSAYRSHETQTALFNNYAKRDGYEKARMYSALPGTSEHETGLAIDVAGDGGKCPAQDCFGDTQESKWLAEHVSDFGFIIRYPEGKESITGYKYEPWHIRYVGKSVAHKIVGKGETLEEYFNAVPVSNGK